MLMLLHRTIFCLSGLATSLLTLSACAQATNFAFSPDETVIVDDDFDQSGDWQLSPGLQIESGAVSYVSGATQTFAIASLALDQPLNPADGAIHLYWRAQFPAEPQTERNAYIPALKYAVNPPFCWDTSTDATSVLTEAGCPDGMTRAWENAELRVWLRPQVADQAPPTRLFVDPDFTSGVEPEDRDRSEIAYVGLPNQGNQQQMYRLRIEVCDRQYQASVAALQQGAWQPVGSPLAIAPADWRFVAGQDGSGYLYTTEHPVTFEAISLLLRHEPTHDGFTQIDAVALTQASQPSACIASVE
jgi:hypothetical protein